jgi:hypothetical protein
MRKSWGRFVVRSTVAAACLVAAASSRAIIINGPAGGGVTTDWDGVAFLDSVNPNNIASVTATLVDPTHLVTAAHAVVGSNNQPLPGSSFTVKLGSDSYSIASIVAEPNYRVGSDQYDIAVITLTSPATGHTTYGWNTGSIVETSEPTTLVGYGIGGDGTNGANASLYPVGTKRAGVNAIDVNTDTTTYTPPGKTSNLPAGLLVYDFDNYSAGTNGPLGGPAIASNEGDTSDGDSGGPMFQLDPITGQYLLTGVTVDGIDALSRFGDVSWGTRVADYAGFLSSNVPEPTSIAPLLLGASLVWRRQRAR